VSLLAELKKEEKALEAKLRSIRGAIMALSPTHLGPKKKTSAATRRKMSEARKKWHATHKKGKP
jgi:hypothetical protein